MSKKMPQVVFPTYGYGIITGKTRSYGLEAYKYCHSIYKTSTNSLFEIPIRIQLRGHDYKLHKSHVRTEIEKNFFSNRVITPWNNLPANIAEANTVASFKNLLRAARTD